MKITLFIVALNELEGLKIIFPKINKSLFHQILIGDGNSTDGTIEWCQQQGIEFYVQKKSGIRHVYQEAWPLIKGDYVITFSPDGNCKVEDLPLIIEKLKAGYDMVIASRYFENAKSEDDDMITAFGNWMFTSLINLCFAANYSDAMTIYRGYKSKLFYDLDLDKEESYTIEKLFFTTMGIEPLLSIRVAKAKAKTTDIPSDEPARMTGVRKLQIIRWGLSYLTQIFREIFYWKAKS